MQLKQNRKGGKKTVQFPELFFLGPWSTNEVSWLVRNWICRSCSKKIVGVYSLSFHIRFRRYLSRCSLKSSIETLLMFLICLGRELKSLGPLTWNLCSLSGFIDFLPLRGGIMVTLPLLSLKVSWIPQLGTRPSRIFHV